MTRVAVVTGASSGIGEAAARLLAVRGYGRLVLVARREDRLAELAAQIGADVSTVAVDLTDEDAPARVREHLEELGRIDLLVNNAGAAWRGTFADKGFENVRRTMELNFDAQLRLTEALLPLLRTSSPSSIVNVTSTAARVARGGSGAYSASKAALTLWTDALAAEEAAHGVHVGLVLPGFIATEGFPQKELVDNFRTRWMVSTPERAAEAIVDVAGGKGERYAPRPYALAAALRVVAPGLVRRAMGGGAATALTTTTTAVD